MILLGYVISVIFTILAVIILMQGWGIVTQVSTQGPYQATIVQLTQIAVAFTGALASAILTATIGRSNEYLKAKLSKSVNDATEKLKSDLALNIGKILEEHKGNIALATASATEKLKSELTMAGDSFRSELSQLTPRRHAAYHTMWAALIQYFRALQKFEDGVYDASALEAGEKACADASGQALLADEKDEEAFSNFWQALTVLSELAKSKKDLPDGLRTIWRNECKLLGDQYYTIRSQFRKALRS